MNVRCLYYLFLSNVVILFYVNMMMWLFVWICNFYLLVLVFFVCKRVLNEISLKLLNE